MPGSSVKIASQPYPQNYLLYQSITNMMSFFLHDIVREETMQHLEAVEELLDNRYIAQAVYIPFASWFTKSWVEGDDETASLNPDQCEDCVSISRQMSLDSRHIGILYIYIGSNYPGYRQSLLAAIFFFFFFFWGGGRFSDIVVLIPNIQNNIRKFCYVRIYFMQVVPPCS